jgi:hypothetical protein
MSERALRGNRLGATSYETDTGIEFAPRQDVSYTCPSGHTFTMPFSTEADIPPTWECRVCGAVALVDDGGPTEEKKTKTPRTHWDMLVERRSLSELEDVLAERLAVLRAGGIPGAVLPDEPAAAVRQLGRPGGGKQRPAAKPAAGKPATRRSA